MKDDSLPLERIENLRQKILEIKEKEDVSNFQQKLEEAMIILDELYEQEKTKIEKQDSKDIIYRAFFENTIAGAYLSTPEGKLLDCNYAFAKILGYNSREEILQKDAKSFYKKSTQREQFLKKLQQEKEIQAYECEMIRNDGETVYCLENVYGIFSADKKLEKLHGYIIDISDKKKAEQERDELNERNKAILNALPDIMFILNKHGVFLDYHCAKPEMLFLSPDTFLGKTITEVLPANIAKLTQKHLLQLFKTREPQFYQYSLVLAEETHFYETRLVSYRKDKALAIIQDTTSLIETEKSLLEYQTKLSHILKHSTILFYSHTPEHIFTFVSPQAKHFFGCEPEEALTNWKDFLTENPSNQIGLQATEQAIQTGKIQPPYELEFRKKTGETIWVEVHEAPVMKNGKTVSIVGSLTDITERKKMDMTQQVLFEISKAVHTTKNIQQLYQKIHQLLGRLIDTTNFFIATYNESTNIVSAPYFMDEIDENPPISQELKESLTAYVIRSRKPLFLTPEKRNQMIKSGDISNQQWRAKIWLGVPLISRNNHVVGAMAVQSYHNEKAYNESDMHLLEFVSHHIAFAIEQRQAEDEIELKSLVLDQIKDLVTITDLNGVITYVNQAEIETMGYSYDQIIGKSTTAYGEDSEHGASQNEIVKQTRKHGSWRGEVINFTKDNVRRILDCRTQIIYDTEGNAVALCGISTDITERKNMERILTESEEKFRTTLQSIGDAVITTDTNSKIQYMNTVAEKLTGWSLEDAVDKELPTIFKIINETTREEVEIPTEKVLREGNVVSLTNHTVLITKQGEEIPIADSAAPIKNEKGEIVGVVLVFRDQTKERAARRKLKRSEAALKYAQEIAKMGSFELDIKNNILRWSENNYRLMGYEPHEIKPNYDLFLSKIHPDDVEMVIATKTQMEKEKKPLHYEFRVLVDGKTKWLQNDVVPLFENEKMIALKGVDIDITKRKKIEERIQRINETLLNLTPDYQTNVNLLTQLFGELVGACSALYNRLDEGLLCSFGQWNTPSDFDPKDNPEGHICYDVIQSSQSDILLVRDLQNSSYYETDPNVAQYQLQTYFGKAVKCNDTYVGSLCAVFLDDFVPTEADKQLLGIIVAAIGSEEERKRAEEALKASEKKFKGLYENAIVGIYRTTPAGDIIMANPHLVKMLGFDSFEELAKRNLNQEGFSDSTLRNHFKKQVERTGIAEKWESIWYRKNGSPIHILESARITYDKDGAILYYDGAVVDITRQKLAENLLKKRLEIEQIVSKLSTDLINIQPEKMDSRIESAIEKIGTFSEVDRVYIFQFDKNKQFIKNTHEWCAPEVSLQKENLQHIPISLFPWWIKKLNQHETIHIPDVSKLPSEASKEKEILENQEIQSALVIPLISNEKLYGFIGFDSVKSKKSWDEEDILLLNLVGEIFINAILRVESNISLQESEERYETFINTHKDFIFVKDENLRYLIVNNELVKFFGKTRKEILHRTDYDLFDEEFAENCIISDKKALEKGDALTIEEKIGSKIYEVTKFPLSLKEGKMGLGGIIHDITSRKEAEEKNRRALEEKETLLQEVYHRTKNNMQVIRSLMKIHASYLKNDAVTKFSNKIGQKIQAMSLIHQKSYHNQNISNIELGNFVRDLMRQIIGYFPRISNQLNIEFDTSIIITHIETAVPFGLALNELISYSLTESINDQDKGNIKIKISRLENGDIDFYYVDDGKEISADYDFREASLDMKNAILLVEAQLKGTINFIPGKGFHCHIKFRDNLYKYRKAIKKSE